jgi:aryl-alcohol dehydrogenase-like predicted oxidoreductase
VVKAALDRGITFFDTGPSYAHGEAERRLGAVLRRRRARGLVVATKLGTHVSRWGRAYKDWSRRALRESLERSLDRLGLAQVSLVHLHGPALEDLTPELIGILEELRSDGLTRFIGVNRRELQAGWRYRFLNALPGLSGAQAALAYALRPPEVATAIFGTTQIGHLEENVAAAALMLPPQVVARIEAEPDA